MTMISTMRRGMSDMMRISSNDHRKPPAKHTQGKA